MAFCKLHNEYWAVNLESLGLDTLSNKNMKFGCGSVNGLRHNWTQWAAIKQAYR